jgi:hypothetical protein
MSQAATGPKIKALAFDAFPIFDPRPVFALAEQLYPGKGADLSNAWRVRQFEYQWLRALSGRYADSWQTTEDALVFAAKMLKLDLTLDKRKQLMEAYLSSRPGLRSRRHCSHFRVRVSGWRSCPMRPRRYLTRASRTPGWRVSLNMS